MNSFDTRGRAIAQAFWTEMEKIAYSRQAHRLVSQANRAAKQHQRVGNATGWGGWKKFMPFTDDHRMADASRLRAKAARSKATAQIQVERDAAKKAIRTGRGNQDSALRILEGKPARKSPTHVDLPNTTNKKGGSSTLRRVAIGTAAGLGLTGAAVGGKRVYDIQKNKKQGYGGGSSGPGY